MNAKTFLIIFFIGINVLFVYNFVPIKLYNIKKTNTDNHKLRISIRILFVLFKEKYTNPNPFFVQTEHYNWIFNGELMGHYFPLIQRYVGTRIPI